jgi:deazaflavin-dependent oxidoreductase (nitroreductase family)
MVPKELSGQIKNPGPTLIKPIGRSFPIAGTNLDRVLFDTQYRHAMHDRLKRFNALVVTLYKIGLLPLFGGSRMVMLLTTKGRKSRKLRSTPIGYFRIGGVIHLFSAWGRATNWYKNMIACPEDVWIQIGLHRRAIMWIELENADEIMRTLAKFVTESPAQAHYLFGWDPDLDQLDQADFSNLINRILIVQFFEKEENDK